METPNINVINPTNEKIGFLQDAPKSNSITRLAFILIVIVALACTTYLIIWKNDPTNGCIVFSTMFTLASGLKIAQKYQESKDK